MDIDEDGDGKTDSTIVLEGDFEGAEFDVSNEGGDTVITVVKPEATSGPDLLERTSEDDLLDGLGGNDTIKGFGGADTIFGGADDDKIKAGNGDDYVSSGAGKDNLAGQGGDTFVFESGKDKIKDFGKGGDALFINHSAFENASSVAQFLDMYADQVGDDVIIDMGGKDIIKLLDTSLGDLDFQDFA